MALLLLAGQAGYLIFGFSGAQLGLPARLDMPQVSPIQGILSIPVPKASFVLGDAGDWLRAIYGFISRTPVWNYALSFYAELFRWFRDASLPSIIDWLNYLKHLDFTPGR